jgi:hypothetical protein
MAQRSPLVAEARSPVHNRTAINGAEAAERLAMRLAQLVSVGYALFT